MTPSSADGAKDPHTDQHSQQSSLQPVFDSTAPQRSQNATPESQANGYPLSSATSQPLTQAEKIKAMVKCVNNLRYLGVESEVPLPKICVVGDQSAGKSSLIEALSGISVPRAEGCCTRCPLEVNLISKDGLWECRVFLMKGYDYLTNSKTSHKASRKHPMGRWSPRGGSEAHPFGVTLNRHEVHDLIHRAQLAILNPSADLARYIPSGGLADMEISSNLEVKFSPNIIRLDIQGPEYCNLSFTDLPGIIAMPEVKSEQFLVDVVANLAKEHIGRKSSIVILTLPMTTDVENSKAFALIQEHNAEERTLGVLTKPDRVQSQGELTRWQEMLLDNSSFRLGHGFHAVMMHPDTKLSREAALGQEVGFFDREDWQRTKLAASGKLGIQSLTLGLENLLATKIAKELPNIMNKVNERSAAIQHELKNYPARPSVDRYQFELGQLISRFGFRLNSLFEGQGRGTGASGLKRKWSLLAQEFREALLTSRPSLEVCSAAERKTMAKFRASSKPSTPLPANKSPEKLPASMEISSDDESSKFADFKKPVGSFTLEDVEECNERRNSTHIPGQIAPPAIEDLNRRSVEHWHKPALEFVVHVGEMVREEVKTIAAEVFSEYQNTDMYIVVLNAVEDFLENALQGQKVEVVKASRMEQEHPLTLDGRGLAREKAIAMKRLVAARLAYRVRLAQAKLDSEGSARGKTKVVDEKDVSSEQDRFGLHIEIMAVRRNLPFTATYTKGCADSESLLPNCYFALCGQHLPWYSVPPFRQLWPRNGRCGHTAPRNRGRQWYGIPPLLLLFAS
jgi:hypothetical protein